MIKHLFIGLWVCMVTLGSAYGTILWKTQPEHRGEGSQAPKMATEQVRTKRISVPVINGGVLKGYVLAQFVFDVNLKALKAMTVLPDIFLIDEVFKAVYSGEGIDFSDPGKPDLSELSNVIKRNVNARLGEDFVQDVFIQELNYVPQERFRGGALHNDVHYA